MDIYMPMSTTERHGSLTSTLFARIIDLLARNEARAFDNEHALVHWGTRKEPNSCRLIDITGFNKNALNELDYVQPDFMLFQKNQFIQNTNKTRVAGYPDLIVEVWSIGNDKYEQEFKKNLYSTGIGIEHWYITQKSNTVICWYDKEKLANQSLKKILRTQNGIEFDLRYLAL